MDNTSRHGIRKMLIVPLSIHVFVTSLFQGLVLELDWSYQIAVDIKWISVESYELINASKLYLFLKLRYFIERESTSAVNAWYLRYLSGPNEIN